MAKGKYIKVTLKNNTEHVVLAANESFYKAQGAEISEPTKAEIEAAFPIEKKEKKADDNKEMDFLVKENEELKAKVVEMTKANADLTSENEELKKQLAPEAEKKDNK